MGKWAYTERILYRKPCSQKQWKGFNTTTNVPAALYKWLYSRRMRGVVSRNRWILTKVTPLIMFWTWLQMVRTVASSFLLPHHLSTRSWGTTPHNNGVMSGCECLWVIQWFNTVPKPDRELLFSADLFVLLAQKAKLQVDVVELPDEFSAGPLDDDRPPLQPHLDCYHRTDQQVRNQLLGIHARWIMELIMG